MKKFGRRFAKNCLNLFTRYTKTFGTPCLDAIHEPFSTLYWKQQHSVINTQSTGYSKLSTRLVHL